MSESKLEAEGNGQGLGLSTSVNSGPNYGSGDTMRRFITPGGNPIDTSQPAFPIYHRKFANPSPLGLLAFGTTTFVLSFYNAGVRGIATPNVVLGMTLGYGGLVQLIAGIEEWACGNTFAATAFSSYGGFWFSFSALYIPFFDIGSSYATTAEFENAVGIYLVAWSVVTIIFIVAAMKSSVALVTLFIMLDLTFWCLAGGFLGPSAHAIKAGGILGILTSFLAFYVALAGMLTKDTSHFLLPVGPLTRSDK